MGHKMKDFKHIARLIRVKRAEHEKRYSQNDLSKLLGMKNGQFISNIERGLCSIPIKQITLVSKVLGIERSEVVETMVLDYRNNLQEENVCESLSSASASES